MKPQIPRPKFAVNDSSTAPRLPGVGPEARTRPKVPDVPVLGSFSRKAPSKAALRRIKGYRLDPDQWPHPGVLDD